MEFFDSLTSKVEPELEDDDDDDDAEFERRRPDWQGAPLSMLGTPTGISGVIFRSEHLFVGLRSATAYPIGVSFGIKIALRRGDWSRERWDDLDDLLFGVPRRRSRGDSDEQLKIGVELADGTRTAVDKQHRSWSPREERPDAPVLIEHGGGGSGDGRTRHNQRDLWLWPLPEGDTLDLVLAWPAFDMPLTRFTINAALLRDAARSALPCWED